MCGARAGWPSAAQARGDVSACEQAGRGGQFWDGVAALGACTILEQNTDMDVRFSVPNGQNPNETDKTDVGLGSSVRVGLRKPGQLD